MNAALLKKLEYVDRRYLFLIMAAAIVLPLLFPFPLPINVTPMAQGLYDTIEALPEGSHVLVSIDYDPTGKPELEPFHIAVMHQLARRKAKMVIVSLWSPAPPLTEQVILSTGLETEYGMRRGVDYVHLGFKEGQQIVMESMGQSLRGTFPVDRDRTPVGDLPLMQEVDTYEDFALLVNVSAGSPGIKEYVQVVQSQYDIPMVGACTAVSGPDYVPYFESGQLKGLAAGMKGAAEYEKLVDLPGTATAGMVAQSTSHLLLIAFIIFGNVMYFLGRGRNS
ncbi:MAG: hypothetical protein HKN12_07775 [Gemmatimonadetes bacterium]|nr:hypothetical protein [Gemmatimonadota bacterium]